VSLRAIVALTLLSLLVAGAAPARQADGQSAAAVEPDVFVIITPSGFDPEEVEVVPGQTVHWTNESGAPRSVTADNALFDSGPIPPGGGFSMTLDVAATHAYSSSGDPGFAGSVQVVLEELPGPPAEPVDGHIFDIPFPPEDPADVSVHPDMGIEVSRTAILLGFEPGATVAEANAALAAAGTKIVGALADEGILLLEAPNTADLSGLDTALASLRSNPAVRFAAMSPQLEEDSVPRPPAALGNDPVTGAAFDYGWAVTTTGASSPFGAGRNWGLEASRFPQAWNLREAIERKNNQIDTGIVDAGFEIHADLSKLQIRAGALALCYSFLGISYGCTGSNADDHGNHVAGIVGADFDNDSALGGRSRGVAGTNPVARLHGVASPGTLRQAVEVFDLLLDAKVDGTIPNLRVINFSMGASAFNTVQVNDTSGNPIPGVFWPTWWNSHQNPTCGPLDNDDGTGNQWCTPNNDDNWLAARRAIGEVALAIAERASPLGVMVVTSAGNSGRFFCLPPTNQPIWPNAVMPCNTAIGGRTAPAVNHPINAVSTGPFAWASRNWTGLPNDDPVLVVEALGNSAATTPSLARAAFSNQNGDVSAPGVGILSAESSTDTRLCNTGGAYCTLNGTSQASPHVAGAVGYLLAFKPSLTIGEVRSAILTWARADTQNARPRLDTFASLLSRSGAAKELVDVNDTSKDGNRRLIYPQGAGPPQEDRQFSGVNGSDGKEYLTAPNGKIDMGDFRRFRDAWLQVCDDSLTTPAGCPAAGDITVDGAANHPKKDLNFDRCTYDLGNLDPANCLTPETDFPRFDFNGDGAVTQATSTVPLKADGSPAANAGEATPMSDLDVLQSQWEASLSNTEGYSAADLDTLMPSGDLEIHVQDFVDAGATDVDVAVSKAGGSLPARTLAPGDDYLVFTVPTEEVTVRASADVGGELLESAPLEVTLKPGEDRRLDLCVLHVELSASRDRLPANGTATATVVAELKGCPGDDVTNKLMTFALEPTGSGHATLNPTAGTTDADGKLTTIFTAGTEQTAYTLTATAELGAGRQATGEIEITTLPTLTISYVWEQETVSWSESGHTRWGGIAGMPDCTTAGVEYCIDSFSIGPHSTLASLGLRREGQLSGSESAFFLTESVINSLNRSQSTWTLSDPDGSNVRSATEQAVWGVLASDAERYQNHALPATVEVEDRPEGILLRGLKAVGELGYTHSLSSSKSGEAVDPIELHATRGEFLLAPRGDGSALRFAVDLSRPIEFERQMDGNLKPYAFCGTFTKDLTTQPGYRVADTSEWVSGAVDLTRKTTFAPGDRPMPVGPGSLTVRYSFAATAASGATAPTPVLPDCSTNNPPDADFDYAPVTPTEGRVVRFFDRSTDPEHNVDTWTWSFGGAGSPPDTATQQDPYFVYHDNGNLTVGLAVEDTEGATDSTSKLVSVANLPPEAGLDDAAGQRTVQIETSFRLWDPGRADQAAIGYELTRTDTGALLHSGTLPAGRYTLGFPPGFFSTAGSYPFTVTATDKDGATASDTATITVTDDPPPPPPEEGPPTPTCDPTVSLDEQEQAFVQEVNDYRAENGLEPVVASPTLTKASERHVDDMVESDFIGHDGSDGSTPAQRAADAGYPSQSTGENLAFNFETAVDVLLGWKSSQTGHNENMLNPKWKAVGIARKEGPTTMLDPAQDAWWWATLYGDVVDCPAPTSLSSTTSLSTGSRTAATSDAGAGVVDADIEPEQGVKSPPPLEGTPPEEIRIEGTSSRLSARLSAADVTEPALAAFTISDVTSTAGEAVTLTNASRDQAGGPIGGTLDVGSGPEPIAAEGTVEITLPAGTFDVELSVPRPGGGELAVTRALTATAPSLPSLSIADVLVNEANDAVFDVMLSAASDKTVTVGFSTADGGARAPDDFVFTSGTLTFSPGQTAKTITVDVVDDLLDESSESFSVNLAGAVDATIADAQGLGTLTDNDAEPTVSIGDATVTEGGTATLTAALSAASGKLVTVGYSTGGGDATEGVDYVSTSGTLVFSQGQVSKMINVPTTNDASDETDETFTVSLGSPLSNVTIGDGQGVGTILDDDLPPPPPPPPPPAPQGPPPDTTAPVMLIATAPVTASKTGAVRVRLTCPPDESLCTGLLTLRSKSRLNVRGALEARLAQVTFGRKAFTLQGGQTAPVTVKLSRKNRALLARLKKVRVLAIVEARDAAGNPQRTQATFLLRAPKRR
jgi:uncharacterized protein YkwD/plastocyanin